MVIQPLGKHARREDGVVRRIAGVLLGGLLVACTQTASEQPPDVIASAPPKRASASIAEPTATPSPTATLDVTVECKGLGRVPRGGEITFTGEGPRLIGASPDGSSRRCLAELTEGVAVFYIPWNAPSSRVILEDVALARDLSMTPMLVERRREVPIWSRPTGTSVIYITIDNRLEKRSSFGGDAIDISFLERHDAVTYHPAGTHIATSGLTRNGDYGLYLATNVGTERKLIARAEAARFITNLHFSEDGQWLYYTARHGPTNWHLHRLSLGPGAFLETLAKQETDFDYAVSPFNSNLYAWSVPGDCAAGEESTYDIAGIKLKLNSAIRQSRIHLIGWLPGNKLVLTAASTGCSTAQPGDVYVVSRREPVLIDEREVAHGVSVRVRMPPPPPPPGDEQEVVA